MTLPKDNAVTAKLHAASDQAHARLSEYSKEELEELSLRALASSNKQKAKPHGAVHRGR